MQMIFIGVALLILAALAFAGFVIVGRWGLRQLDAQRVISRAQIVEREAARREVDRRRFVMDGSLRGTKAT